MIARVSAVACLAAALAFVGDSSASHDARNSVTEQVLEQVGLDGSTTVLSAPFASVARGSDGSAWTLAPDTRHIAFIGPAEVPLSETSSGRYPLELADRLSGNVTRIGAIPGYAALYATLSFSPDGQRVAIDSFIQSKSFSDGEVRLLDLRTSAMRLVEDANEPLWSPGTRRLAYTSGVHSDDTPSLSERPRVVIAAPDGTRGGAVGLGATPSWSPDGRRVAFSCRGICVGEAGHSRRIARAGYLPQWSPRGDVIAYLRANGAREDVWLVRPDGSGARRLARRVSSSRTFTWLRFSPDGKWLALTRGDSDPPGVTFLGLNGSVRRVAPRAVSIDRWLPDSSGVSVIASS